MELRPAVPEDMSTVAEIWHRAWHVAHPGHVPAPRTPRPPPPGRPRPG